MVVLLTSGRRRSQRPPKWAGSIIRCPTGGATAVCGTLPARPAASFARLWHRHRGSRARAADRSPPATGESSMNEQNDLVNRQRLRILLWRLPAIAIVASSFLPGSRLKGAIWTVAFGQMGLA